MVADELGKDGPGTKLLGSKASDSYASRVVLSPAGRQPATVKWSVAVLVNLLLLERGTHDREGAGFQEG